MLIKSFKIDHKKLLPGIYLHDVKKFNKSCITTFDLRFKKPNNGDYLSNVQMHTLEHLIATYYSNKYPNDKIYFGPMGCQTGFYLVIFGKKDIRWLKQTLPGLDRYINNAKTVPGNSSKSCGNYKTLNLKQAKAEWNKWYKAKAKWGKQY